MDERTHGWFKSTRLVLDTLASIAMIGVGILFLGGPPSVRRDAASSPVMPADPISLEGSFQEGDIEAAIGVLIFTDFQCPYCERFATGTVPQFRTQYVRDGRVSLAMRHLPLQQIHKDARRAAAAAVCASQSGLFWPMHDAMFAAPGSLDEQSLILRAKEVGMDQETFRRCVSSPETDQAIAADISIAERLGIRSTPTTLVGRIETGNRLRVSKMISGAVPIESLQATLDQLLQR